MQCLRCGLFFSEKVADDLVFDLVRLRQEPSSHSADNLCRIDIPKVANRIAIQMSHLLVTEGDWLDALQLDGYHHGILLYNWFVLHMCYNTKLISVVNKKLVSCKNIGQYQSQKDRMPLQSIDD